MDNILYGLAYLFDVEDKDGTLFYFFNTEEERDINYNKVYDVIKNNFKGDINIILKKFTFTLNENLDKNEFLKEMYEETEKKDILELVNELPKIKELK